MTPELKCTELNGAKCIKSLIEPVKHMCTTHRLKANGQGLALRLAWSFQAPRLTINHTWLRRTLVLCHFLVGAAMVQRWICLFLPRSPLKMNSQSQLLPHSTGTYLCLLCTGGEHAFPSLCLSGIWDTCHFLCHGTALYRVSHSDTCFPWQACDRNYEEGGPPKAAISLKGRNTLFLHSKRQSKSLHSLIFPTLLSSLLLLKLFPWKRQILANLVNQEHSINLVLNQ